MSDGETKEVTGVTTEIFKIMLLMDEIKKVEIIGY